MTFNPNIPQPNDDPTASQADLLGNFGKLNSDWAVNHTPLTSGGNNGFHKMIQFPTILPSDPVVTGLQSVVYPKVGADGAAALFFKNAIQTFQLTNIAPVVVGTNFGLRTPLGFTINAGTMASGVTTANFAIPFANAQIFAAQLTAGISSVLTNYSITAIDGTSITISTQLASPFNYLVIGN